MEQNKKTPTQERLRAKITGIALGVLMVVSFVVIGYEVLRQPSQLQAVSEIATNIEEPDIQEFTNLRDQNRQQAKKIKQLNEELLEATRKIHELRAGLFARTSPQDKAKIADLTEDLRDREVAVEALRSRLSFLEEKAEKERRMILRLEQTQEALALMNEKEKLSKEAITKDFQEKISALTEDYDNEKTHLLSEVKRLEEAENSLKDVLNEKQTLLTSLEDELSRMNETYANESHSHLEIKTLFENQIQDLLQTIEKEQAKNQSLINEVESSQANERAQMEYAKQIQRQLHDLEKEKLETFQKIEEQNALIATHNELYNALEQKYNRVAALLNDEEERVRQFAEHLSLAQFENESYSSQIAELEIAVQDLNVQSLTKEEDLKEQKEKTNSFCVQSEEQQKQLLEKEEENKELKEELENRSIEMLRLQEEVQQMMSELNAIKYDNNEIAAEFETEKQSKEAINNQLQEKQNEIHQLQGELQSLKEIQKDNQMQLKIQELEDALIRERNNYDQLRQTLEEEKQVQSKLQEGQQQMQQHFFSLNELIESQEAAMDKIHHEHLKVTHEKETLYEEVISLRDELAAQQEKFNRIKKRSFSDIAEIQAQAQGKTYTTKPGDTLKSISLQFYGNKDQWLDIFEANQDVIDDFNELSAGITIILPQEGLLEEGNG